MMMSACGESVRRVRVASACGERVWSDGDLESDSTLCELAESG